MADLGPLAGLEAAAIGGGVKLLYSQATDILNRRRRLKDEAKAAANSQGAPNVGAEDPAEALHQDIEKLAELIRPYIEIEPANAEYPLDVVDALRCAVELATGKPVTFEGEGRRSSPASVASRIDVERVQGYAAAVRVRHLHGDAEIRAESFIGEVAPSGQVVGVEIGELG